MVKTFIYRIFVFSSLFILSACNEKAGKPDYDLDPVSFKNVSLNEGFWLTRQELVHNITIPHIFDMCEITGRLKNFRIAGGLEDGTYSTKYHFDDSDVFKALEAASYSLANFPDPGLEKRVDLIIKYVAAAQEEDGYIYTNRTIMGDSAHVKAGPERWIYASKKSHELYNMGHLIEAGVAHYECTGKRTLLNVAIKAADLICDTFGYGKIEKFPGHEEIEIAMVRLYRLTGEIKYLDQAEFFLDIRGPGDDPYKQAHVKVNEQFEAKGHAVRAMYLYSAMRDVAALKERKDFKTALDSLWNDVVHSKMYVTGGIGPGKGYSEGFGPAYFLPDATAYCETCSSIGDIFWNYRMFKGNPDSRYFDVLERVLYNSFLSGLSLSGDQFFYTNRLASDGKDYRKDWYPCSCCPPNIARLIASLPGYIYAKTDKEVYVNLFASSEANFEFGKNESIKIVQETEYPWSGDVRFNVNAEPGSRMVLKIRIPGWAKNEAIPGGLYKFTTENGQDFKLRINGEEVVPRIEKGYAVIDSEWTGNDEIDLSFKMPVKSLAGNEKIESLSGRSAIQRGPVVYCMEWIDQSDKSVFDKDIPDDAKFKTEPVITDLDRVITLSSEDGKMKFIPYFAWANRGRGEMAVWLPVVR